VSDCLSRKPLWEKDDDEDLSMFAEVRLENFFNSCSDPLLDNIFDEAAATDDYNKIIEALRDDVDPK
jgi:hypothetical protein